MPRHYSLLDRLAIQADAALRTLVPESCQAARLSPAVAQPESELDAGQRKHVAGLMRINHTGEVCAQALYQGQALTARRPEIREAMEHAAEEEWTIWSGVNNASRSWADVPACSIRCFMACHLLLGLEQVQSATG